ncbi:MAG TPA: glycosyltransferase family 4 protein [Patescibacteria group bacterium]|nr:glycosyltransferase family 4 protein [Patescibacteria group bacterium]
MEKTRLTIGFYNPYFDGFGGGERYTLTLASHWSKSHEVVLFWDDPNIVGASEKRFGLDLSRVRVTPNIFKNANIFGKLWESKKYDLIFFVSDGSIPASLAKHNILHFQVPFPSILVDSWKMKRYDSIVCNSRFTKEELDPQLGVRAVVIYPPVQNIPHDSSVKRKKQILSVGRFTSYFQAKKQEVLIEAFGKFSGYELIFAGSLIPSDQGYFDALKARVKHLPVRLLPNISNEELIKLYQSSQLYWHAAGFGETDPTKMEHFGISTVEAMSAGVVPLVFAGGGQLEIVSDGVNGVLWNTPDELIAKTFELIKDKQKYSEMSKAAIIRASDFDVAQFSRAFDVLIAGW